MRNAAPKLSPKQERFVQEYLVDLNATQAAIRAGYSKQSARVQASRMLTKANVQDAIAAGKARLLDDADSRARLVLDGLRRIAEANILDYLDLSDPKRPAFDLGKITRDHGTVIEQVSLHPRTGRPHIKLYDKVAAFGHLGKFEGLSKERLEHTGPDGGPLRVEVVFVEPSKRQSAAGR